MSEMGGPRVAVVTGAASGIGQACTMALVESGWAVVGWDLNPGSDPSVSWRAVDVADWESVSAAASDVPRVELLINSAGISNRGPAAEMTQEQWDSVLQVDLSGTFYCCRMMYKALRNCGGTVVNVASIAGHRSFHGRANYCAAKAGVVALTEVLGFEWAETGVRVFGVSPGFTRTMMWDEGVRAGLINEDAVIARTPQNRIVNASNMAQAIVGLADSRFDYLTGTTVVIDGGWCANGGF